MYLDYSARNDRIVADIRAGKLLREAAAPWGISASRAYRIAAQHGVRSNGRRIPDDKMAAAVALVIDRGAPIKHAANSVGCPAETLRGAMIRAGLHKPINTTTPWTATEERVLRRDYGKRTAAQIATSLGRTRNEVIGRAYRMGLRA